MSEETPRITVIDLSPHFDKCCVCDEEVQMQYGLAMYEDLLVPDDWPGEWGGFTACKRCYDTFTGIKEPITIQLARAAICLGGEYYGA